MVIDMRELIKVNSYEEALKMIEGIENIQYYNTLKPTDSLEVLSAKVTKILENNKK